MILNPALQYDTVQWSAVLTLALACNSFHFFIGSESYPLLTNNFISSFLGLFSVKHKHSRNETIYHTSKAQILLPIEVNQGLLVFFLVMHEFVQHYMTEVFPSKSLELSSGNQIKYHTTAVATDATVNPKCLLQECRDTKTVCQNKFLNKKQIYQSISKPQS